MSLRQILGVVMELPVMTQCQVTIWGLIDNFIDVVFPIC
jgi:hypothetical protein